MILKKIKLTQGKFAKVDDDDFERVNQWKWSYHDGYADRNSQYDVFGKRKTIKMHRVIMNTPDGMETDHRDRDGLNNQKNNLRICTEIQNRRSRGRDIDNTSGYKGVTWRKSNRKWVARIAVNRVPIHLGSFSTSKDAALAYDRAAKKYYGEFAYPNFQRRK